MSDTMYADCDGLSIAYQVMGDGPIDIIMVPGIFSHVELYHEFPQYSDFFRKLSAFSRVIAFDKRGQGLSDRIAGAPTWDSALMTHTCSNCFRDDWRRRVEIPAGFRKR